MQYQKHLLSALGLALLLVGSGTSCTPDIPDQDVSPTLTPPTDADNDGVPAAEDCNEADANIYPGATELCDGLDQDCDQVADDGALISYYYDQDQDGFGTDDSVLQACTAPLGYAASGGDCNDQDATLHPTALEACDGIDNDCDALIDEEVFTWYLDRDQDGHGTTDLSTEGSSVVACAQPAGYAATSDDCNDLNSAIYAGASEVCDGLDNNCDTAVDEGIQAPWYPDADRDGYGALGSTALEACAKPDGYAPTADDCDDTQPLINPAAKEFCNSVDDNCDGEIDEVGAFGAPTWYRDEDGDGFGTPNQSVASCTQPFGFVANKQDCNDLDAAINPTQPEVCDGIDNDCSGSPDPSEVTDSDADGIVNCLDPEIYAQDFSSTTQSWEVLDLNDKTGNWSVNNGCLRENDGSADSLAYFSELGALSSWSMQADVTFINDGNDGFGFVFGLIDTPYEETFLLLNWDDPTNEYKRYNPAGEIQLFECTLYYYLYVDCTRLASDPDTGPLTFTKNTVQSLKLSVNGKDLTFSNSSGALFTYKAPGNVDLSLRRPGFYSENADGGICFDNLKITVP